MTEDEARTNWCPQARVWDTEATQQTAAFNRIDAAGLFCLPKHTNCIASACMAWRWREVVLTQGQKVPMPQGNPDGYCGLAGNPDQ